MKKINITYNPYLIKTSVLIEGKTPKPNSRLNFGKIRLQEWANNIADILVEESRDKNFQIEFVGLETDFEDLQAAISEANDVSVSFIFKKKPSVEEVEHEVNRIFIDIQNGPIEKLRDNSIVEAFKKSKNQLFEVNVVATMSSGKSTLINALIDKKLMPVANMATTATIVRIIDTEQDNFSAKAYDKNGKVIREDSNIIYKTMKEWNSDESISSIDIYGRIPCVKSAGMKLVLVDTPGPNNSRDPHHQQMTYRMLENSDKSLVLFVMNGTQLNVNDEKNFMDYVCDCMAKGGKQSRERYIFAINKMDSFNPEDESPEDALKQAKNVLEDNRILYPNIFPVSAQAALEARTHPLIHNVKDSYANILRNFKEFAFDDYYEYNHLPISVQKRTESMLVKADEDTGIEIHSGIVSIEQAISLYVNKYARTQKVRDLVDTFNNRLNELKAIASLKADIRDNVKKKEELDKAIKVIQDKIESGRSAKTLSKLIEKKELAKNVTKDINDFVDATTNKINSIIFRYSHSTKVRKSDAIRQVAEVERESQSILNQLDSHTNSILERGYRDLYEDIIEQYVSYIKDLGLAVTDSKLTLKPLDFVAEDIADVDKLLRSQTQTVDEGKNVTRTKRVSYNEKKTNWFWEPWNWGTDRYEIKWYDKKVTEWEANYVEYVNMSNVVCDYFEPIQDQLEEARIVAKKHAKKESVRIKEQLKNFLVKIDQNLQSKLNELKQSTETSLQTKAEIAKQESDLEWMKGIIERVNGLINF